MKEFRIRNGRFQNSELRLGYRTNRNENIRTAWFKL